MPVSCELAPDAIATTKTPGHRLSVGILGRLTGRWTFYRIDGAIWKIALEIPTIPRSNGKKVGPFRREGKSRESGNDMGQAAAVERIAPAIGAEIHGIDLGKKEDDATFAVLHDALIEHQVIFLRNQSLDVDQHMRLARRFGTPLYSKKLKMYGDKYDSMSLLENDGTNVAVGSVWHTDNTDYEEPPMGSLLYCEVAPSVGGDTIWCSMYAAYEGLAPSTRGYIDNLTALHDNSNVRRRYGGQNVLRNDAMEVPPPVEHPVVLRHPVTGRKALFVNSNYTVRIKDVSDIESRNLLDMLFDHVKKPEFQVRFRWRANSLAIWDNRCTQHYALDDYRELRRMRRVQIAGTRPQR